MNDALRITIDGRDATREELILAMLEERQENARLRERLRQIEGSGYGRLGRPIKAGVRA